MSKKEDKVIRLWGEGVCDLRFLAKRIGYEGAALTAGIEKVKQILTINGIKL